MESNTIKCLIYRSTTDESDGETVTLSMLIPSNKLIVPNTYENVVLLSNMRKLLVYTKVHERFGNPPEELMLPDIEEIRDESKWNENSGWTFIRWNILFEERDVITTLNALKELANPIRVHCIVVPLSDRGCDWIEEFGNVVRDLEYSDNCNSIVAETA